MLKAVSSIANAIGALNYVGTWNASTNTPTITSSVGVKGDYYQVSVAGSTSINGISNWGVGDVIAFNGSTWQRIEGGADVNAVNLSYTGTLTGGTGVVNLGTNQFHKDASGNIGIGTASPAHKLDVIGQGRATTGLAVSTDGSTFTPSGLNAIPNYGVGYITSTSQVALSGFGGIPFYTNQLLRAFLDGSGRFVIGGASASASAMLDVQSTTMGVRMPNMTTTQKNAIASPAAGLMVFDTTLVKLSVYSGTAWQTITSV